MTNNSSYKDMYINGKKIRIKKVKDREYNLGLKTLDGHMTAVEEDNKPKVFNSVNEIFNFLTDE